MNLVRKDISKIVNKYVTLRIKKIDMKSFYTFYM